jgi:gliding motility-associated-like protein
VDPPIHPGFTHITRLGCTADTVFFTNISTSPGFLWYVWHFGDGTTDTSSNPTHIYHQGTPIVTLLVTNHHCLDSASISLNLDHPIKAIFSGSPLVCQNVDDVFTNTSIGVPPTFKWSFGDGNTSIATNPAHKFKNTGTYEVRLIATNLVPCSDTAYQTVVVDSQTIMSMHLSDTAICRGAYVTMNSTYTNIGNTGIVWDFGNGDSVKDVNPAVYSYYTTGSFTVKATAKYRVCADVSVTRKVDVWPTPQIDLGPDTSICEGGAIIRLADYTNTGKPGATWKWNTGAISSGIEVTSPGFYAATVSFNHCSATDSVWIKNDCYIALPNIFTPNNDGLNDFFCPRDMIAKGLSSFSMNIYNRWGQLIFETKNIDGRGWDGMLNDVPQPEGVYMYVIDATFKDGKKERKNGNITLLR